MHGAPSKRPRSMTEAAPKAPRYEFAVLVEKCEELRPYARWTSKAAVRLDLSTREATYALSRAILHYHFNLHLSLPPGQLVPTVPNRVQYLTWAASLLGDAAPDNPHIVLDIGTGPSCIYPMLGTRMFPKWKFVATDIDKSAIDTARGNINANSLSNVSIIQTSPGGALLPEEVREANPDLIVCNPPFHKELPEVKSLSGTKSQLVTEGGELTFLQGLADESTQSLSVAWFTSLVGRKVDLPAIVRYLRSSKINALHVKTVELSQGGRTTRWAVAWSFGDERSSVSLRREFESKWRLVFAVRPSRAFANQLLAEDIAASLSTVLLDLDWVAEDEAQEDQSCQAAFQGLAESAYFGARLQLNVADGLAAGEFCAHVKVTERGSLTTAELHDLGNEVVQALSDLLNPS